MNKEIAVYDNQISAREYIGYIAESAGCFACAGRDGKLYFRQLGEDEIEISIEMFGSYKWGEKITITKVSYEDGIRSFKLGDDTGNNLWISQDNMYIVDKEQIENIYNQVKDLTINSFEGSSVIDPAVDIGDKIIINGKAVIYQGEMILNGNFMAEIKSIISIQQKQETTARKESQKVINRRIQSEINQIDGTIKQLAKETTENTEKITEHTQDIDSIKDKVSNVADLTRSVNGVKTVTVENCIEGNLLELHIYGNNEVFEYLYPSDNLYPSDTLYPKGDSRIVVTDKDNKSVVYELGVLDTLRQNGDVRDEYVLTGGQAKVIRRINKDGSIKVTPVEVTLNDPLIKLSNGTNTIAIKNYSTSLEVKYAIKSEYTEVFASRVEMNATIEEKADSINMSVNKKLQGYSNTEEMNSAINMKAESIISSVASTYETKNETDSKINQAKSEIKQTTDSISTTVLKKVGENEVISKINQSAETVGINADKIKLSAEDVLNLLSGNTINISGKNIIITSDCLNIGKDGSMTFKVNGTKIFQILNLDNNKKRVYMTDESMVIDSETELSRLILTLINGNEGCLECNGNGKQTIVRGTKIQTPSLYIDGQQILPNTSDRNLKKNIKDTEIKAIDRIKQIRHRQFDWRENGKHQDMGYIAQELEEINPNYIHKDKKYDKEGNEIGTCYQVNALNVLSDATKAMQEQQEIIENLQEEIKQLKEGK